MHFPIGSLLDTNQSLSIRDIKVNDTHPDDNKGRLKLAAGEPINKLQ